MQDNLISRRAVLDYIHRILNQGTGKKKSFEFIQKYVEKLPSVNPQPCEDVISRKAVLDLPKIKTHNMWGEVIYESVDVEDVKQLPPVKPQEKTGHWIKYGKLYQCSECKELSCCQGKFCNECGVRMESEKNE